jgi:hypothetical protein
MSEDNKKPFSEADIRKINEACHGAPRLFHYPKDAPLTEEERRRYAEIDAKLPKTKRKARRRR